MQTVKERNRPHAVTQDLSASDLYGDYELIIDSCLNGDPEIKRRVAEADAKDRSGLASLKYHLGRAKVVMPTELKSVMRSCESDQDYFEDVARDDFDKIDQLPSGKFRVRLKAEHNRYSKTFEHVEDARTWRDRMVLLSSTLGLENR